MDRNTLISIIQEELEDVMREREMTSSEDDKKERIVKDLKAKVPYLKKKYGDRWKSVMYAIATKTAMGESEEMTDKEVDNREKVADRLMKKKADFKKRYGDNWEDVLYATATKLAMSGDTGEEEND